jgi:subfamily B ATP-binding cassette protein MsbA
MPHFMESPLDGGNALCGSLRGNLALVSQDIVLFNDTVRANIAYGRLDTTDDEIIAAAKKAHAHEFISALSQGYDTPIGPHGVKLSGGQRQRLSIARAVLKNAPILLLDEATSALDNASERAVQDALTQLMRGRTTLVIAHRLSTIIDADTILVLDGGRITGQGTHSELLASNAIYRQMQQLHQTMSA